MRHVLRVLAVTLTAVVGGYALAATIGSRSAVNAGWDPPARGVTVWIEDNGIHTSLVLPKNAAGVDLSRAFAATDVRDPRHAGWQQVAVSWGERAFFVQTPTWWDVRPTTVLRAATGSDTTVLHVEHVAPPVAQADVRPIVLRPEEYRRLAAFVLATKAGGSAVRGYGGHDAFYPAHGRYDAVRTCNEWTRRALAFAGVRTGRWTPAPGGLLRWY